MYLFEDHEYMVEIPCPLIKLNLLITSEMIKEIVLTPENQSKTSVLILSVIIQSHFSFLFMNL